LALLLWPLTAAIDTEGWRTTAKGGPASALRRWAKATWPNASCQCRGPASIMRAATKMMDTLQVLNRLTLLLELDGQLKLGQHFPTMPFFLPETAKGR